MFLLNVYLKVLKYPTKYQVSHIKDQYLSNTDESMYTQKGLNRAFLIKPYLQYLRILIISLNKSFMCRIVLNTNIQNVKNQLSIYTQQKLDTNFQWTEKLFKEFLIFRKQENQLGTKQSKTPFKNQSKINSQILQQLDTESSDPNLDQKTRNFLNFSQSDEKILENLF